MPNFSTICLVWLKVASPTTGLTLSRYCASVSARGGNGSFGSSSYSQYSFSLADGFSSFMKLLTFAFLGVGGVKFFCESLLFAGDLKLSLEFILVVLGLFGSDENIDLLNSLGVLSEDRTSVSEPALVASAILGVPDISCFMRLEDVGLSNTRPRLPM